MKCTPNGHSNRSLQPDNSRCWECWCDCVLCLAYCHDSPILCLYTFYMFAMLNTAEKVERTCASPSPYSRTKIVNDRRVEFFVDLPYKQSDCACDGHPLSAHLCVAHLWGIVQYLDLYEMNGIGCRVFSAHRLFFCWWSTPFTRYSQCIV